MRLEAGGQIFGIFIFLKNFQTFFYFSFTGNFQHI